jgi:hypothetical protein
MIRDTAGDPMTDQKWTRKTTQKISQELRNAGIDVSAKTVARLLKNDKFRLRANAKKLAGKQNPHRNEQFEYIKSVRDSFAAADLPAISIDTKKKELVGQFKNAGQVWAQEPIAVKDHDFRSDAIGMAIPYGVYDLHANRGFVVVGTSHDTPFFAVDCLARWWVRDGRSRYPGTDKLLILADGGGSNGARTRAWKCGLQTRFCDRFRLTVTVCHYPPATSKWNPIEHRLFSEISKAWAGEPLNSYDKVLGLLKGTTTSTGLVVRAEINTREYQTGVKISATEMRAVNLKRNDVLPDWNYTISPNLVHART